jgi:DNA-binding XRE family transcriptional regulator
VCACLIQKRLFRLVICGLFLLDTTVECNTCCMTGKQVIGIREGLGLTQAKLAAKIGVARNTVSRWEAGAASISPLAIRLLERAEAGELEEAGEREEERECDVCYHLMAHHFINYRARGCLDCGDGLYGSTEQSFCYAPQK